MSNLIPGFRIILYKDDLRLGATTKTDLQLSRDTTECAGRTQGQFTEHLPGRMSWSCKASKFIASSTDAQKCLSDMQEGTDVYVVFAVDFYGMSGTGKVTNIKMNFDKKGSATFDITIMGNGTLDSGFTGYKYGALTVDANVSLEQFPPEGGTKTVNYQLISAQQQYRYYEYGMFIRSGVMSLGSDSVTLDVYVKQYGPVSVDGLNVTTGSVSSEVVITKGTIYYRFTAHGANTPEQSISVRQGPL